METSYLGATARTTTNNPAEQNPPSKPRPRREMPPLVPDTQRYTVSGGANSKVSSRAAQSVRNKLDSNFIGVMENGLNDWIEKAPNEKENLERVDCKNLILKAYINGETGLILDNRGLSSLPKEIGYLNDLDYLCLSNNQLTELPEEIGNLINLKNLVLSNNQLVTLPKAIGQLSSLRNLELNNNCLYELPQELGNCKRLIELDLNDNDLRQLPEEISKLINLKVLSIKKNRLRFLPTKIGDLKCLKILNLSENKINELPNSFFNLSRNLKVNLRFNHFTVNYLLSIADVVISDFYSGPRILKINAYNREAEKEYVQNANRVQEGLAKWIDESPETEKEQRAIASQQILDCYRLKKRSIILKGISSLPSEIGFLIYLEKLTVKSSRLTSIPPEIGKLYNLISLNLSNNQITSIPSEIGEICFLKDLDLNNNLISVVPDEIGFLKNLRKLNIACNELEMIPASIGECRLLQRIDFNGNKIQTLPGEIGALQKLTHLCLSDNILAAIPVEIGGCSSLKELDLSENEITSLPSEIGFLSNLEMIDLHLNRFDTFPAIHELSCLQVLNLNENLITALPEDIIELPSTLEINLCSNSLSFHVVTNLQQAVRVEGYSGPRFHVSIQEREEEDQYTLEEHLEKLAIAAEKESLKLEHLKDNQDLRSWLSRLSSIGDYRTGKRKELAQLIYRSIIKADTEPKFRDVFMACIIGANATCGDRMALSLLLLGIQFQISEALENGDVAQLAYLLGHGKWVLRELEEVAEAKVKSLNFVDEIEVFLAYPVNLKGPLHIPISIDSMLYFACSNVTAKDLEAAEKRVKELLSDPQAYASFLTTESDWQECLQKHRAAEYGEIYTAREAASESIPENAETNAYVAIAEQFNRQVLELTLRVLQEIDPLPFLKKKSD